MRGKGWLYAYGLTAIVHVLAILGSLELVRFVTKPLLMPFLLVYFLSVTQNANSLRPWIGAALVFSWVGDIFLMNAGELYFIAGLASFLLAHVCYIFFFAAIRRKNSTAVTWQIPILISLGLYIGLFYLYLLPHLSSTLKIPVFVYALMIATMFAIAWHAFPDKKKSAATWCILGAALFIASDSMLAVNSFVNEFPGAGLAIMSTYILAQLAIVTGSKELVNFKLNTV